MTTNLSNEARTALINVGSSRQGAVLSALVTPAVLAELQGAGLVGKGWGLTPAGCTARDRAVNAALDAF